MMEIHLVNLSSTQGVDKREIRYACLKSDKEIEKNKKGLKHNFLGLSDIQPNSLFIRVIKAHNSNFHQVWGCGNQSLFGP